ncbi:uncharacterized protein HMPREF1541_09212 [Cyphellophora europaea CBS 101466]|uniref:CENP-V/GFA domain-containing protein n=1 Tax=Cyphellophora europaea (strain CBS 101466) TaxID=1220924 RepID=W2S9K2_CYPE1|nr:uncharacterized protein HMPREF1541_09212 [Cyphellophora europaea CBS 101466]ETN45381.1 hypothetical protein HMPREF1541_09212 [Cyphellophora europaea CBS 101466]
MTSDHGWEITSHFCDNCGVTIYRSGGSPTVDGLIVTSDRLS